MSSLICIQTEREEKIENFWTEFRKKGTKGSNFGETLFTIIYIRNRVIDKSEGIG